MRRKTRPKAVRDWQRERTKEWRQKYYALGLTYRRVGNHWAWTDKKKKGSNIGKRARIILSNPKNVEAIKKKLRELSSK